MGQPVVHFEVIVGNAGHPGGQEPQRHECGRSDQRSADEHAHDHAGVHHQEGAHRADEHPDEDPRLGVGAVDSLELVGPLLADRATVAEFARLWAEDWPCEVDESGTALTAPFSAPSAGPLPWHVYRIDASGATALQTVEPGGATRWTF